MGWLQGTPPGLSVRAAMAGLVLAAPPVLTDPHRPHHAVLSLQSVLTVQLDLWCGGVCGAGGRWCEGRAGDCCLRGLTPRQSLLLKAPVFPILEWT